MADQHGRHAALLRDAQEARRGLTDLGDRARGRAQLRCVEGLHGVDHAHRRPVSFERRTDRLELGLGEDRDVVGASEALGPKPHLRDGLLPRDEQRRATRPSDRAEGGKQQRRLPHAGLPADEHERGRNEAAAEDTVELGHPGLQARRLGHPDVAEPLRYARCARRGTTVRAVELLDQRSERSAPRTASEPAPRRRPALAARELHHHFRHGSSIEVASDVMSSLETTICAAGAAASWPYPASCRCLSTTTRIMRTTIAAARGVHCSGCSG